MKLTKKLNEIINSGITLTDKETQQVEEYLFSLAKPVKPQHLEHYLCLAAMRDKGSDKQSY